MLSSHGAYPPRDIGPSVAWPLAASAQQPGGMRRIGVLITFPANDLEGRTRLTAFSQALQQLGWTDGRNVRIDTAGAVGGIGRVRPRRHPDQLQRGYRSNAAGDPHRADRFHGCHRPGRRRFRRKPGAPGHAQQSRGLETHSAHSPYGPDLGATSSETSRRLRHPYVTYSRPIVAEPDPRPETWLVAAKQIRRQWKRNYTASLRRIKRARAVERRTRARIAHRALPWKKVEPTC